MILRRTFTGQMVGLAFTLLESGLGCISEIRFKSLQRGAPNPGVGVRFLGACPFMPAVRGVPAPRGAI